MNRRVVTIAAGTGIVIVLIGGLMVARGSHPAVKPDGPDVAPVVQTARATYGPFVVRVHAEGRIGGPAGTQSKLAFTQSGVIAKVYVTVGQTVAAGETLAALDASGFALDAASARSDAAAASASYAGGVLPNAALASAQARLAVAAAKLRAAQNRTGTANSDASAATAALRQSEEKVAVDERSLARAQQTYEAGVTALKDVEAARAQLRLDTADVAANQSKAASTTSSLSSATTQAEADYKQALTDVQTAQAQVSITRAQAEGARDKYAQAERALANSTLRAAESGVVTQVLKHVGETVDPTQPVIVIGRPSQRVVTLAVNGGDGSLLHVGDPATVTDPVHSSTGAGHVTALVPSVDPTTQTTTALVSADPPNGVPGDAVTATIDVGTRRGVIVPASAVVADPQSGKSVVFVLTVGKDGAKFAQREVTVAESDDRNALLGSGVKNGEKVATQGAFDLLAPGGGGG